MRERGHNPSSEETGILIPLSDKPEEQISQRDDNIRYRSQVTRELAGFGLPYNEEVDERENGRRVLVLKTLRENGLLEVEEGKLVFDIEKIKSYEFGKEKKEEGVWRKKGVSTLNVLLALEGLRGYDKRQWEEARESGKPAHSVEIFALPADVKDMVSTSAAGYASRNRKTALKIWEVGQARHWDQIVVLQSGEEVSHGEIALADLLQGELKAIRDRDTDKLEIFDKNNNKYVPFTARAFHRLTGIKFSVLDEGKIITLEQNPLRFITKMAPHLLESGLIRENDVSRISGSKTEGLYGKKEKTFGGSQPYVMMESAGISARYYLGKSRVAGAGKDDPDAVIRQSTRAVELGPDFGGITDIVHGKQVLKYVFPLLTEGELKYLRQKVIQDFIAKHGRQPLPTEVTGRMTVRDSEVSKGMKKYSATEFIKQRADETAERYAERVEKLSDVNFVLSTTRAIFSEAGVGVHNLPWREQLIIAAAVLEEPRRERLANFAKTFGLDGLRALTAVEYDFDHVQHLLSLSEQRPEVSQRLFKQYGKTLSALQNIVKPLSLEGVSPEIPAIVAARFPVELEEALKRRAKDLLMAAEYAEGRPGFSFERQEKVMESVTLFLEILQGVLSSSLNSENGLFVLETAMEDSNGAVHFKVSDQRSGYEYLMKFFIRPVSSRDGQARINMALDFNTAKPDIEMKNLYEQTIIYTKQRKHKMRAESVLRVGIDLEDRTLEKVLSLDLGRNEFRDAELQRDGDVLAKTLSFSSKAGAHSQDSFSKVYAPYFKQIAEMFVSVVRDRADLYRRPNSKAA